jgi:hypothetical protein
MKRNPAIGRKLFYATNLLPIKESDLPVEVIDHAAFVRGEPATNRKYYWPLSNIQRAVFVRFLDGPYKGKVSMASAGILQPRKGMRA